MQLEAGDLILVPFPFTDLTAAKTRPALVLTNARYNREGRDVIVCGVTSNLSNASHSVLVDSRDLAQGRLPAPSRVKVDKVVTLDQTLTRRRVGRIKAHVLRRVLVEFYSLFPSIRP